MLRRSKFQRKRIVRVVQFSCEAQRTSPWKSWSRRIWFVSKINMDDIAVPPDNVLTNHTHRTHGCPPGISSLSIVDQLNDAP